MKNLFSSLFKSITHTVVTSNTTTSGNHHAGDYATSSDSIVGRGPVVEETRPVEGTFDAITVSGATTVNVTFGAADEYSINVRAQRNILDNIHTRLRKNILHIDMSGGTVTNLPINVDIVMPVLVALGADGAANVAVENLQVEKFTADVGGAAEVIVSGTALTVRVEVAGAANVHMGDLRVKTLRADISDAAHLRASVSESAKVEANGAASVIVTGNPANRDIERGGAANVMFV